MEFDKVVIYHSNCPDGSAAAIAAYQKFGVRAEYWPWAYNRKPPEPDMVDGKDVYMIDFSVDRDVLEGLIKVSKSFIILDHHDTALRKLGDHPNCILDMNHSGATLSWAYFNQEKMGGFFPDQAPEFFRYCEDRDLWANKMPHSKEISCALLSYGGRNHFSKWLKMVDNWDEWKPRLIVEGGAISRNNDDLIASAMDRAELVTLEPSGEKAYIVNCPMFLSELGEKLALQAMDNKIANIGITYFWDGWKQEWCLSFRSRNDFAVNKIAEQYGGGGHPRAAACTVKTLPWKRY